MAAWSQTSWGRRRTRDADGLWRRQPNAQFCYVADLVEGIARLLAADFHEPVNLGNPNEVTILEFAKEIVELSRSQSRIEFKPLPQDDPRLRRPDISRAIKILGWQPKIERREGMRRTLEFFREKVKG